MAAFDREISLLKMLDDIHENDLDRHLHEGHDDEGESLA
jgi:hypothetical protein